MKKIVLASNSPRRRELLAGLGCDFEVKVIGGITEGYPDMSHHGRKSTSFLGDNEGDF